MKSFASALLFSGLAVASPLAQQQKRYVHTEVQIETVWTTTTFYVGGATPAAEAIQVPSSVSAVPSASPIPSVAPSVVPSVAVPSVVSQAAPSVAAPSPAAPSVAAPVADTNLQKSTTPSSSGSSGGSSVASGTGDATWYDVTVGAGSCGFPVASSSSAVVAMSVHDMNNGANSNSNPLCGKTITINYGGATHSAQVYDSCEGCAAGSIDLSQGFFKEVFPSGDGRVSGVSWTVS